MIRRFIPLGLVVVIGSCAGGPAAEGGGSIEPAAAIAERDTDIAAGAQLFAGRALCYVCHGMGGAGTPLAPSLTDSVWLNITDPTVGSVAMLIAKGVASPISHPAPMPPMGGARLSDEEVEQLALYVMSIAATAE